MSDTTDAKRESVATDKVVRAMTSEDEFGGRVYTHPITGEEFRSVTTLLKAAANPHLERWKLRTIAEFAADNREMLAEKDRDSAYDLIRSSQYTSSAPASATGEAVHSRIEDLCDALSDFRTTSDDFTSVVSITEWMRDVPAGPGLNHVDTMFRELLDEFEIIPIHTEATLINRTVGYAGSSDLIVWIRKRTDRGGLRMNDTGFRPPLKRAVIDAKSGKTIYGSVSLQLVGYGKAEHILNPDGTESPMPVIHETYSLHVRPRSWALRPMRYDAEVWSAFKSLVRMDRWIHQEEQKSVGAPINAGAISRMRTAA